MHSELDVGVIYMSRAFWWYRKHAGEKNAELPSYYNLAMGKDTSVFCVSKAFGQHQTRLFDEHPYYLFLLKDSGRHALEDERRRVEVEPDTGI